VPGSIASLLDGSATVQARDRLDPRAPFVLDVRELGRRPGAMQRISRTVPAPAGLGLDVIGVGVPEGSDIELNARLESVSEGVLVTATLRATVGGECSRCLDPIDREVVLDVQELFVYDPSEGAADDEEPTLEGDLLDLEPAVRDAVVLELPVAPLCRDDCPGLCPECGVHLADAPDHVHESSDPRWSALQALVGETSPERETPGDPTGSAGPDQEVS
jgi:uncharacterized protein